MTTITGVNKLTTLKFLADGRPPAFVAAAVGASEDAVTALGAEYGWPDRERLRWAVDELQRQARVDARSAIPKAAVTTAAQAIQPAARPATPSIPRSTPMTTPTLTNLVQDPTAGLLARADKLTGTGTSKVKRCADKLRQAIVDLEEALAGIEAKKLADARAAAEKSRARQGGRAPRARAARGQGPPQGRRAGTAGGQRRR